MVLNKLPTAEDFYKTYWNKKPFVVRGALAPELFDTLISADELGGLSLEDEIKSRLVITAPEGNKWECHHGPFEEDRFSKLGETNWSLLVQNVEQYHTDTAHLLSHFQFAPRWLMDDVMVSYSTPSGSVGPHIDSYHVFLVQGMGKRTWKVGDAPIHSEDCIEGLDLKVLKNGFDGQEIETSIGDVIYIPPHFAHEGKTLEEAMTFSVGFLGPQLSELLIGYGCYLEETERNARYSGQSLNDNSAGFFIASDATKLLQDDLVKALQSDHFLAWLAQYFSKSTHDEIENDHIEETFSNADILKALQNGDNLYRPEHIKPVITTTADGQLNLAIYGEIIPTSKAHEQFIHWIEENAPLSMKDMDNFDHRDDVLNLITYLCNRDILLFEE